MKTKVLKYNLVGRSQVFVVSLLALLRKTGLAGEETSGAIPAEVLDTLKIQLVSPNVTGAQILTTKLTRPCHYSVEGNELTLRIQNDKIVFLENGGEIAYWQNRKFYAVDGEFINSLRLGKFAFLPR